MEKQLIINGWLTHVYTRYNNMCDRKGIDKSKNTPFFTVSKFGNLIVGIKKPII